MRSRGDSSKLVKCHSPNDGVIGRWSVHQQEMYQYCCLSWVWTCYDRKLDRPDYLHLFFYEAHYAAASRNNFILSWTQFFECRLVEVVCRAPFIHQNTMDDVICHSQCDYQGVCVWERYAWIVVVGEPEHHWVPPRLFHQSLYGVYLVKDYLAGICLPCPPWFPSPSKSTYDGMNFLGCCSILRFPAWSCIFPPRFILPSSIFLRISAPTSRA